MFKPSINLARNGFRVNVDLANAFKGYDFLLKDLLFAESYAPNGTLLAEGDICYRKRFANTLEKISWYGAGWFCEFSSFGVRPVFKPLTFHLPQTKERPLSTLLLPYTPREES